MANWQLGKKDEAHRWYEEGMNWMDTPGHKPAILLRTQNEAAELLGLGEKAGKSSPSPRSKDH